MSIRSPCFTSPPSDPADVRPGGSRPGSPVSAWASLARSKAGRSDGEANDVPTLRVPCLSQESPSMPLPFPVPIRFLDLLLSGRNWAQPRPAELCLTPADGRTRPKLPALPGSGEPGGFVPGKRCAPSTQAPRVGGRHRRTIDGAASTVCGALRT